MSVSEKISSDYYFLGTLSLVVIVWLRWVTHGTNTGIQIQVCNSDLHTQLSISNDFKDANISTDQQIDAHIHLFGHGVSSHLNRTNLDKLKPPTRLSGEVHSHLPLAVIVSFTFRPSPTWFYAFSGYSWHTVTRCYYDYDMHSASYVIHNLSH